MPRTEIPRYEHVGSRCSVRCRAGSPSVTGQTCNACGVCPGTMVAELSAIPLDDVGTGPPALGRGRCFMCDGEIREDGGCACPGQGKGDRS